MDNCAHDRGTRDIERLVNAFETGRLPPKAWNHSACLTLALWYMTHLDEPKATARLIHGIRRLQFAPGIEGRGRPVYHETLTLFWLAVTRGFLREHERDASIATLTHEFLRRYGGEPNLYRRYYSRKAITSWQARNGWVEPDLQPLEF